jgi:hypothetical protein
VQRPGLAAEQVQRARVVRGIEYDHQGAFGRLEARLRAAVDAHRHHARDLERTRVVEAQALVDLRLVAQSEQRRALADLEHLLEVGERGLARAWSCTAVTSRMTFFTCSTLPELSAGRGRPWFHLLVSPVQSISLYQSPES